MVYTLDIETRRRYYQAEVEKHGKFELNRLQALRRAKKLGRITETLRQRYHFDTSDLPWLPPLEDNDKHHSPKDKAFVAI